MGIGPLTVRGRDDVVMQAVHWVASEGKQRVPGGGIGGAAGMVTPAGRLHAVDPETGMAMCGEPMGHLIPFRSMQWAAITTGLRCRRCLDAISAD